MNHIDESLTRRLQAWLEAKDAYASNIEEGATLLLKFTRNRYLYARALARPQLMAPKVARELRKYLRMQLDRVVSEDVVRMTPTVMSAAGATLAAGAPAGDTDEDTTAADPAQPRLGKRADHDRLPADVQALWTKNAERWHKIRKAYNSMQALIDGGAQPCDLYETLKALSELDETYRKDMAAYDAAEPAPAADSE